jgi:hypothetical protein
MRWTSLSEKGRARRRALADAWPSYQPQVRFAWIPICIGDQWVWWEYYTRHYNADCLAFGGNWSRHTLAPSDQEKETIKRWRQQQRRKP